MQNQRVFYFVFAGLVNISLYSIHVDYLKLHTLGPTDYIIADDIE